MKRRSGQSCQPCQSCQSGPSGLSGKPGLSGQSYKSRPSARSGPFGAPGLCAGALVLLTLGACHGAPEDQFPLLFPPADNRVDFDRLAADPGVYAGRIVALEGWLSIAGGQACLIDRNRRIAVRLTAEQAAQYDGVQNWPVRVEGVFSQTLCPPFHICPEFCTPYGLDSGVRLSRPTQPAQMTQGTSP